MEDLKSKLEQSTEAENRANDTIKQMETKLSEEIYKSESLKIGTEETIRNLQSNASRNRIRFFFHISISLFDTLSIHSFFILGKKILEKIIPPSSNKKF